MRRYQLSNGLTLIYEKKPAKSVSVAILVKAGSNYENKDVYGISHFIEHMLFEGTMKRKNSRDISNEIEKLGGEMNAYTTTDRTVFFVKILGKHFDAALDVLSDIMQNSVFDAKTIEKERKVILKEIDMVNDQPRFLQWIFFNKNLFSRHPAKNPAYGSIQTVGKISRKDILSYYNKYYVPNNLIISVVGNVRSLKLKIEESFKNFKYKKAPKYKKTFEFANKRKISVLRKKLINSYMVFGYKTFPRLSKESYTLDLILGILGRGQSGWIFDEIRNKRGLAYEVGVNHEASVDYGHFAIYLNTDKKNINQIKSIILEEFKKLKKINAKEINEAKTFIEGQFLMENEDNFQLADKLAFWELIKDAKLLNDYIKNIKRITKEDITKAVDRFLNDKYTLAIIQQK